MNAVLTRTVFATSRALEFFSEKELTMQIGYPMQQWPVALCKELMDNALDACESVGAPPVLHVTLTADSLSVEDNGPGLPRGVLERSLDYLVRVSDKAYYVSPTRGQLGNALKCVWAASFVADGRAGAADVEVGGKTYNIRVSLAPFAQEPHVSCTLAGESFVKTGTKITLHWAGLASYLDATQTPDFYNLPALVQAYAAWNPHATFTYTYPDGTAMQAPCTNATWRHWLPSQPTSPHWYSMSRFEALLTAYLAADQAGGRVRTVREVVAEFAGLKGIAVQRRVCEAAGLTGATLADLIMEGTLDLRKVRTLLTAMQAPSRAIKPQVLGVLGQAHCRTVLCAQCGADPRTLAYKKLEGTVAGVPYVLEVAFGARATAAGGLHQAIGINWAPALRVPFEGWMWRQLMQDTRIEADDPVTLLGHLAFPAPISTDRGKSRIELPYMLGVALREGIEAVAHRWTKHKRQLDRDARTVHRQHAAWLKAQAPTHLRVKDAAFQVMEAAYLKASGHGRYPANARQIMYAARPEIIALTGKASPWSTSAYFTQTLLPDFMDAHPDLTAGWDVVFDARGHFQEPHTGHQLGIGTLEVRSYIQSWESPRCGTPSRLPALDSRVPTSGPAGRYQYALFIEKEGFNPLLEQAQMAAQYDLALMSTKGMTVTAARRLVEALAREGVTILVLHDFDKSGFEILDKFTRNTRRYTYEVQPTVIDLGLRLVDAQALGLQSEDVLYPEGMDPRHSLRTCGATASECAFLVQEGNALAGWRGERIELNAMTSDQFIDWLHQRLTAIGVTKYVPDAATLALAYRRQWQQARDQATMAAALAGLPPDEEISVPATLIEELTARLTGTSQSWDDVLASLVHQERERRPGGFKS